MPYTISFEESSKISPQIRKILRSFPEVTIVADEHGRPDDGTDPTGFFNCEYYVGLKPYAEWKGAYRTKAQLISAISQKLQAFPGIIFNYTQPAEDAVDEAETGLKSSLAVKVFGPDLKTLESKGKAIKKIVEKVRGIKDVTLVQELGQPSLASQHQSRENRPLRLECRRHQRIDPGRHWRHGGHPGGAGRKAVRSGGPAGRTIPRHTRTNRRHSRRHPRRPADSPSGIRRHPGGEQRRLYLSRKQFPLHRRAIFRGRTRPGRGGQRRPGQVKAGVPLPEGYYLDWGGEYTEYTSSRTQLRIILPLTLFLIFLLLFALYSNLKFPFITVLGVLLTAPVGGIVALWLTHTPFSVSSGIGFLALFGVSVQTAVVYISYVNELRRDGGGLAQSIREGAILRLRPIMMTALVAALGLLPAAMATGVGTDSQRPFALVIVSGLFTRLLISVFLMPALYALVARPADRLEV